MPERATTETVPTHVWENPSGPVLPTWEVPSAWGPHGSRQGWKPIGVRARGRFRALAWHLTR